MDYIVCNNCHESNPLDSNYCGFCGEPLKISQSDEPIKYSVVEEDELNRLRSQISQIENQRKELCRLKAIANSKLTSKNDEGRVLLGLLKPKNDKSIPDWQIVFSKMELSTTVFIVAKCGDDKVLWVRPIDGFDYWPKYSENVCAMVSNGYITYLDQKGQPIFEKYYQIVIKNGEIQDYNFKDGVAYVSDGTRNGFVDKSGHFTPEDD